ncbi:sugar phosphate nucleotidyltransferase, partial [Agrobacterium pusense]
MKSSKIYPLILCGGSGTRLWPMSRETQPKQFQPIEGKGSLTFFQQTVQRHRGGIFARPIVSVGE